MRNIKTIIFWCAVLMTAVSSLELPHDFNKKTEDNADSETARDRRGVIEEEKFYNIQADRQQNVNQPTPWLPGPLLPEEDPTTKISLTNEVKDVFPSYQTTEKATDRPTGRGARASNENWVKLPYPNREDSHRDDILTPPQPSGELINSRMPRVNFVTQNRGIEASESRHDKEIIQRATRKDDLRTEFVRPDEQDRNFKPVYPRQAVYYPEESRRPYYEDRYNDDLYRRDPYYDTYERRRYPGYGPRIDRYDEAYDNYVPRKPKRIIYYAHLPEVVRTPPNVDLRYRYSVDPYRRYDDDVYARNGRYDYKFRNRYPYAPLRKDERNFRDLAPAGTDHREKKVDEKVTPAAVLPQKEDKPKSNQDNRNVNRNVINSHQYHDSADSYSKPTHKTFQDVVRPAEGYFRFEEPLFQSSVDDPYQRKY
ncbi:uncharacterized protein LOC114251105 [Bombyx mandarina]|uniref:Uncharacterized protein LOC114251105 n=1 Tax=Bombyx mandarina TaxID=7092 RepID=A0A6J2KLR7_BOMMA|nr:uncharacterized protein LOC114251105 [Bombyx mandarina]XP_028041104.1 uncharacterized protein LOC114251105 [Bombyx mandarina]